MSLADFFEGRQWWLVYTSDFRPHRPASVFSIAAALRPDSTSLALDLSLFFRFFFLFCCFFFLFPILPHFLQKNATRIPGCDAADNALYLHNGGNKWLPIAVACCLRSIQPDACSVLTTEWVAFLTWCYLPTPELKYERRGRGASCREAYEAC
jgi:hypothetical protein